MGAVGGCPEGIPGRRLEQAVPDRLGEADGGGTFGPVEGVEDGYRRPGVGDDPALPPPRSAGGGEPGGLRSGGQGNKKRKGGTVVNGRWRLNRAGIFNFWYYDEEIFPFSDGKLLLRGTNGSGKSVTMQSLIPLLLDGKKSPDRLDPFGSRARRIEDYLLGEKGVVDRDERTGYLYLEYRRRGTEQTLTTGIGLRIR